MDIGSGRAYLSAQLSSPIFDNSFNVIAIDSSSNNVESSLKRLKTMKRKTTIYSSKTLANNKNRNEASNESSSFQTFSQFIQSSTELNNLIKLHIQTELMSEIEISTNMNNCGLIGLHSCGNLSNSIINLYLNNNLGDHACNDRSKFRKLLCNVACCYNLLNEKFSQDDLKVNKKYNLEETSSESDVDRSSRFPMSSHLNEKKYSLTFNIRMLACHSMGRCLKEIDSFKEVRFVHNFLILGVFGCQQIFMRPLFFHIPYTKLLVNF